MFNGFDIAVLVVIIVFIVIGYVRGAIGTLFSFLGSILSVIIANIVGRNVSPWIYDNFCRQSINDNVTEAVNNVIQSGNENIGDEIISYLPEFMKNFVSNNEVVNSLNSLTGNTAEELSVSAADIIQQIVSPVCIQVISVCVTVVLFVLLSVAVNIICHFADSINKIPIVGKANRIVGGIIGLLYGVIVSGIIVFAISIVVPFFDEDNSFKENIQDTSLAFSIFGSDNSLENTELYNTLAEFASEGE